MGRSTIIFSLLIVVIGFESWLGLRELGLRLGPMNDGAVEVASRPLAAETPLALTQGAAVTPRPAAPSRRTIHVVDDAPMPGRPDSFRYIGRWEHVSGVRDGRSAGTSSQSFSPTSTAELRFTGDAVRLYGVRGPKGGRAFVSIDGEPAANDVDFFSSKKSPHSLVFESGPLKPGVHRLMITVLGSDGKTEDHPYVNIDGAEYFSSRQPNVR